MKALTAIVGGTGLAWLLTLRLAGAGEAPVTPASANLECDVEVRHEERRVVVALGPEGQTVVVEPEVHVETDETCVRDREEHGEVRVRELRIRADAGAEPERRVRKRVRIEIDRARAEVEGARVQIRALEGLEGLLEDLELEGLEQMELDFEGLDGDVQIEIEKRLEEVMERLDERLNRLDGEVGT